MKTIKIVGGTWDDSGGKPSKLLNLFVEGVRAGLPKDNSAEITRILNGGNYNDLKWIYTHHMTDILYWFPDIPNDKPKLLEEVKKNNPDIVLVASKRIDNRVSFGMPEAIDHLLKNKVNLGLVININDINGVHKYTAKIIDPLGNLFASGEDFVELGRASVERALYLSKVKRVGSQSIGEEILTDIPEEFLGLIKKYADEFDCLIPRPKKVSRFLGNAVFRCTYGMPAFRKDGLIYVSRRNVDKSGIESSSFVAVKEYRPFDAKVFYYGNNKPSVDTPINLLLLDRYPNINYLIHGHVYVDGAQTTLMPVPCGSINEFEELVKILTKDTSVFKFICNLKGHGFIAGGATVGHIKDLSFKARPAEEKN